MLAGSLRCLAVLAISASPALAALKVSPKTHEFSGGYEWDKTVAASGLWRAECLKRTAGKSPSDWCQVRTEVLARNGAPFSIMIIVDRSWHHNPPRWSFDTRGENALTLDAKPFAEIGPDNALSLPDLRRMAAGKTLVSKSKDARVTTPVAGLAEVLDFALEFLELPKDYEFSR